MRSPLIILFFSLSLLAQAGIPWLHANAQSHAIPMLGGLCGDSSAALTLASQSSTIWAEARPLGAAASQVGCALCPALALLGGVFASLGFAGALLRAQREQRKPTQLPPSSFASRSA